MSVYLIIFQQIKYTKNYFSRFTGSNILFLHIWVLRVVAKPENTDDHVSTKPMTSSQKLLRHFVPMMTNYYRAKFHAIRVTRSKVMGGGGFHPLILDSPQKPILIGLTKLRFFWKSKKRLAILIERMEKRIDSMKEESIRKEIELKKRSMIWQNRFPIRQTPVATIGKSLI